jgi:hypothetical protein
MIHGSIRFGERQYLLVGVFEFWCEIFYKRQSFV